MKTENEPFFGSDGNEIYCDPSNTLTLSAENLIGIGIVVSEILPAKLKSRGTLIQAGIFIQQNTV